MSLTLPGGTRLLGWKKVPTMALSHLSEAERWA